MGIFGDESDKMQSREVSEEVKISAPEPEKETDLKREVESKFSSRSSQRSKSDSSSVSVEDLYEQNERIIELLESIAEEDDMTSSGAGGGLNGVL